MISRKTKRVAAVTALSAALIIGGTTAFAASDNSHRCDHPNGNNGKGHMIGAPSERNDNAKGKGWENGWPGKCADQDQDGDDTGGDDTVGDNTGGTTDGGGSTTANDDSILDISVEVNVGLPDAVGTVMPVAESGQEVVESITEEALEVIMDAATLVRNDVANTLDIADLTGAGVTGTAVGGVTVAGSTVGGSAGLGGNIGPGLNGILSGMLGAF